MLKTLTLAGALAILAGAATAHEFVLKPAALRAGAGESVAVEIHSTHVMIAPEEAEGADSVSAALVAGGETVDLGIEPAADHLVTAATLPGEGPAWLVAHRHAQVWSKTAEGWVKGGRDEHADAETAGKYEKFSKALLNAGGEGAGAPLGHALEIVPLADPATLSAGDSLALRVLHDGAPISATVYATFDGFSDRPNTYAYVTDTAEAEGGPTAEVKTWAPGTWIVRVQHDAPGSEAYDAHVLRATLVFEVAG